jgi:hypothetical protein
VVIGSYLTSCVLSTGITLTLAMHGQLVQIGPAVGHPDPNYCIHAEHITPNLRLSQNARISGVVFDQTGAPFKRSPIELRIYLSEARQASMKKTTTDEQGKFDLGEIKAGQYRLLASPTRVFGQSKLLTCADKDCILHVELPANPTDMPTFNCPIR